MARILLTFLSIILGSMLSISESEASPCCGQNSSSLNIMTLRQGLNLALSQTQMKGLGRVFDQDDSFYVWPASKSRDVAITQLSAGYSLSQRWQVLATSSWQRSIYASDGYQQTATHMMDTTLGVTFEALPEYSFSYYKPIIYLTLFANLPTGRSVFAGPMGPENIAVTGHDQWGSGIAVTLQKNLRPWTMMLQMKSLRLFADTWLETPVDGFFDSSVQLLLGYNLPIWDLNLNFSATQLELLPRTVTLGSRAGLSTIVSPNSRSTMLSFGLSRMVNENVNLALSYNDQTLIGDPRNTLLAQGVSLVISYNHF